MKTIAIIVAFFAAAIAFYGTVIAGLVWLIKTVWNAS